MKRLNKKFNKFLKKIFITAFFMLLLSGSVFANTHPSLISNSYVEHSIYLRGQEAYTHPDCINYVGWNNCSDAGSNRYSNQYLDFDGGEVTLSHQQVGPIQFSRPFTSSLEGSHKKTTVEFWFTTAVGGGLYAIQDYEQGLVIHPSPSYPNASTHPKPPTIHEKDRCGRLGVLATMDGPNLADDTWHHIAIRRHTKKQFYKKVNFYLNMGIKVI